MRNRLKKYISLTLAFAQVLVLLCGFFAAFPMTASAATRSGSVAINGNYFGNFYSGTSYTDANKVSLDGVTITGDKTNATLTFTDYHQTSGYFYCYGFTNLTIVLNGENSMSNTTDVLLLEACGSVRFTGNGTLLLQSTNNTAIFTYPAANTRLSVDGAFVKAIGGSSTAYGISIGGTGTLTLASTSGTRLWSEGGTYAANVNATISPNAAGKWRYTNTDKSASTWVNFSTSSDTVINYSGWKYEDVYFGTPSVTLNGNGGNGTELTAYNVGANTTLPIDWTKTGRTFIGWYDNANFYGEPITSIGANDWGDKEYYARWTANTYTATLDPQSGTGGTASVLATYDSAMPAITLPTRDNYTFAGYYASPDGEGTQYYSADGSPLQAWDQTIDATLYALWTRNKKNTEINDTTTDNGFAVTDSNLDEIIDRIATPADTSGDNVVTLSLNISDIDAQTADAGKAAEISAIKTLADKGSEVYFFDVSLTKKINTETPTTLTNIPVPVKIHIKLDGDLANKTYYRVYRYHGGVAEQISSDKSKIEHYRVDVANSEIIIHTMKFSTYAIFGNDDVLALNTGYDVDVQAKITADGSAVYKIDIAWGAMTFEWDASGQEWNPDTHTYDSIPDGGVWTDASHNGFNNRIVCANHSNGSLLASFAVSGTLGGVAYDVFTANDGTKIPAVGMSLPKVPVENDPALEIKAYLWLSGEPDSAAMVTMSNVWQKVGVITVTFTPDTSDIDKTPKN